MRILISVRPSQKCLPRLLAATGSDAALYIRQGFKMERGPSEHDAVAVTNYISIKYCVNVAPAELPGGRPASLVESGMQTWQNDTAHLVTYSVSSIILIRTGAQGIEQIQTPRYKVLLTPRRKAQTHMFPGWRCTLI